MKVTLLTAALTLSSCSLFAQKAGSVSQNGTVHIPVLQSVEAVYASADQTTLRFDDLKNGKLIENFCQVVVKSNVPWRVSVRTDDNIIHDATQNNTIPTSKILIKAHNKNTYLPLSSSPVVLNDGNSDQVMTTFGIDVKIDADYTVRGGNYPLSLVFTVSAQ